MDDTQRLAALEQVCAIDSRTNEGAAGVTQVSQVFADQLKAAGFELQWYDTDADEPQPRGRHLVARRNPKAATQLLLIGHTDTVLSPADVPWQFDRATGRVQGSGVCDMKGCVVVMLEAIERALAADALVRDAGLIVLINAAEETGSTSFQRIIRDHAKPPVPDAAMMALGFEPARPGGENRHFIVNARKGVMRYRLEIQGRAAHAGGDHALGVNAGRELARLVEKLESITDHDKGVSVNVGIMHSGQAVNQVPETAEAQFEVRAFEPDTMDDACRRAEALCAQPTVASVADGATTQLSLIKTPAYQPWAAKPADHAMADRYAAIAAGHGFAVEPIRSGGGADASWVADLMPAIDGLGILGGAIHSRTEWADLNTMAQRAAMAAEMIASLCVEPIRNA